VAGGEARGPGAADPFAVGSPPALVGQGHDLLVGGLAERDGGVSHGPPARLPGIDPAGYIAPLC